MSNLNCSKKEVVLFLYILSTVIFIVKSFANINTIMLT